MALPEADIYEQIRQWESRDQLCSGTGLYEYLLGKLHIRAKQYGQATRAFEAGIHQNTEYNKALELAFGDMELGQGRYSEAEKIYRQVAQKYPDWFEAHRALGVALWTQGELKLAIEALNHANELNPSVASYRVLTMAYQSIGDYQESVRAFDHAYALNPAIVGDRDPMIAAIRSYTDLGKFEVARNALAMLLRARPDIRTDEEYLKAGFYLRDKMQEAAAAARQ